MSISPSASPSSSTVKGQKTARSEKSENSGRSPTNKEQKGKASTKNKQASAKDSKPTSPGVSAASAEEAGTRQVDPAADKSTPAKLAPDGKGKKRARAADAYAQPLVTANVGSVTQMPVMAGNAFSGIGEAMHGVSEGLNWARGEVSNQFQSLSERFFGSAASGSSSADANIRSSPPVSKRLPGEIRAEMDVVPEPDFHLDQEEAVSASEEASSSEVPSAAQYSLDEFDIYEDNKKLSKRTAQDILERRYVGMSGDIYSVWTKPTKGPGRFFNRDRAPVKKAEQRTGPMSLEEISKLFPESKEPFSRDNPSKMPDSVYLSKQPKTSGKIKLERSWDPKDFYLNPIRQEGLGILFLKVVDKKTGIYVGSLGIDFVRDDKNKVTYTRAMVSDYFDRKAGEISPAYDALLRIAYEHGTGLVINIADGTTRILDASEDGRIAKNDLIAQMGFDTRKMKTSFSGGVAMPYQEVEKLIRDGLGYQLEGNADQTRLKP